jgi:hypothetical protein
MTTMRTCYLAQGDPARAVDFDETPEGHAVSFDENGDLVGLTLIDIRRLLDEAQGELRLEPRKGKPRRPQARAGVASVRAWRKASPRAGRFGVPPLVSII